LGQIHVGIIGGGIAGLVAGYDLAKAGVHVTLLERNQRLGGLAGSFVIQPGLEVEKYYHFICKPDRPYLEILRELGLESRVRWTTTEMGLFYHGALYTLSDPFSLLAFPHLTWMDKARFSWSTLLAKFRNSTSWKDMEDISARDWLTQQYGERTYRILYKPLLDSKFGEYASHISAAWMWARLHRLGNSRTVTQQECVGYVEGGSQVFVDALEQAICSRRVEVQTSSVVEQIIVESGRVAGIRCNGALWPFDHVLSTVPIPFACKLLAGAQDPYFDDLRQLEYIGVMVTLLRIKRQFSKHFWVNVSDTRLALAGFIEYTNLNPCRHLGGDALIYLPQYLPHSHELYQMADQALSDLYCGYLQIINPDFERGWVREYWIHRDQFAQPICGMGFSRHIPAIQTPIDNLFLTDSYQLHPYDRSISGSTWLGRKAAQLILSKRKESARD